MSKFSCACGYVICDQTDSNPNKGELLSDRDYSSYFDWLAEETNTYIAAAQSNDVRAWLSNRGYSPAYPAEQLSHGEVLRDHLHSRLNQIVNVPAATACMFRVFNSNTFIATSWNATTRWCRSFQTRIPNFESPVWVVFGLWRRLLDFRPGKMICSTERPGSAKSGHSRRSAGSLFFETHTRLYGTI
jgi:hypothetical protein